MRKLQPHIAKGYFQSFREGKEGGFDYFFRAYYKSLCFFANRYLKDMPAAEDIVSESFIKVWEKRESMRDETGLRNYLYTTVYHGSLRWMERKKYEVGSMKSETIVESFEENVIRAEVMNEIYQTIDLLPTECKRIFTKLYLEGKTVKEIAEELSLSTSTVKTQKARALDFLRRKLSPLGLLAFLSFCGG